LGDPFWTQRGDHVSPSISIYKAGAIEESGVRIAHAAALCSLSGDQTNSISAASNSRRAICSFGEAVKGLEGQLVRRGKLLELRLVQIGAGIQAGSVEVLLGVMRPLLVKGLGLQAAVHVGWQQ